ncbi:tyrosine-type recombinase/integrase [uncultured Sphingorhabdus sp.]|uniref:tyrosine-type recombinase/integrase n=1 Tax=uncultured Sphingorhabdus sp. TaxID=1686106 RepID=UPI002629FDA3|nr:tyrosine-type recombinase/integrase [uncultured Sphingorhabdus sp.]HMS19137.1 tyrosine-type recombinase/integrase [Sphingorhabdus sp.]
MSTPDNPWGIRNRAIISLRYDILAHRSELVALMSDDVEERSDGTLRLIIRRSKTDPFGMGRLAFTSLRTARLVAEWLAWRGPEVEPLFCGIYQEPAINRALGPDTVKLVIKRTAKVCGLQKVEIDAFSTHSLRVGAAQDLLRNGHDTAAIMRAGGWKSVDVMARYLEFAEHNVWV